MSEMAFEMSDASVLRSALAAVVLAQMAKIPTTRWQEGRWDWKAAFGSGGMPSSHAALVAATTMAVGLQAGFSDILFGICAVFSLIVCYDACGVRLHAGRTAEVLNKILVELPEEHPAAREGGGMLPGGRGPLRESLGHTQAEVIVGATLGVVIAAVVHAVER